MLATKQVLLESFRADLIDSKQSSKKRHFVRSDVIMSRCRNLVLLYWNEGMAEILPNLEVEFSFIHCQ